MVANRSGVLMAVTSTPSRTGVQFIGGGGPAMAAVEELTRGPSAELAPQGIRVVGLRPQGIPETGRIKESFELEHGEPGRLAARSLAPTSGGQPDRAQRTHRGFEAGLRYETGEPYRRRLVPPNEPGEGV
jgi:NAD(P)-dependent dehydrogenase (short-subunit alcohol dehydrogenase family)